MVRSGSEKTRHRPGVEIPDVARRAIAEAVDNKGNPPTVADLTYLGLPHTMFAALEKRRIYMLETLLHLTPEEILQWPNVSVTYLNSIYEALSRYHLLEAEKRRFKTETVVGMASVIRYPLPD